MKPIVGLSSAYDEATRSPYGANMTISARLVVEMAEKIKELNQENEKKDFIVGDLTKRMALMMRTVGRSK
tara:strand:+ start:282 stop:491 length:210 start_codon:yes stop_codon:yes gene_type:complete